MEVKKLHNLAYQPGLEEEITKGRKIEVIFFFAYN